MPSSRSIIFVLVAAVAVTVLFLVIDYMSVSKSSTITTVEKQSQTEFAATWLFRIAGGFIATASALALLLRSLDREPIGNLLPFVLPLLGGVLLAATHWSVAIAMGIVVIGLTGKDIVASLSTRRGPP